MALLTVALGAMLLAPAADAYVRGLELRKPAHTLALTARHHPQRTQEYVLACTMFLIADEPRQALVACNRAVESDPRNAQALLLRGALFLRLQAFESAALDATLVLGLEPRNADALVLRGRARLGLGRADESLADFDRAVTLSPKDTDALDGRASAYQAVARYGDAIRDLGRSIALDPRDPAPWNGRCWVKMLANTQLVSALSDCRQAAHLAPSHADVLDSLGWVYVRLGQPGRAVENFRAALAKSPKLASSWFGRGTARLQGGDEKRGRMDIARAEVFEPGIAHRFRGYGIFVPPRPVQPKTRPATGESAS